MTINIERLEELGRGAMNGATCGACIHQKACKSLIHSLTDDSPCDFDPPMFVYNPFTVHPDTILKLCKVARAAIDACACPVEKNDCCCMDDLKKALAELEGK